METREAAVFYDLVTRDGRCAIEIRTVAPVGEGLLYASQRATIYSCAYNTQSGRIAAFGRAVSFCTANNLRIRAFEDGCGCRAAWQ